MKKIVLLLGSIFFLTLSQVSFSANNDIRIGVLAPRGELKALTSWTEFGKYISGKIGQPVQIVPLVPSKVLPEANAGHVDFVLSHPPHTIALKINKKAKLLATLSKKDGPQFAGVIISKKGSGITKAADLRGKKVMSMKFNVAAGAYIFQTYYLKTKGIDVQKDLASIREGKKQDDLVYAVKAGVIDAAFIRSGLLESMQKEGKIKMSNFTIVDQRTGDGLPLVHTTPLYPEWYLSAVSPRAKSLANPVKKAALQITPDMAVAKKAKIKGFVPPLSLKGMTAALKSLKITPFNK